MLLRTRITIFVSLAFIAIISILLYAGRQRQEMVEQQLAGAALVAQIANWTKFADSIQLDGKDRATAMADRIAVAFSNPIASDSDLGRRIDEILPDPPVPQNELLEVVNGDGTLVYWSARSSFPNAAVRAPSLIAVQTSNTPLISLERAPSGVLWIAVTVPIMLEGRTVGAVTLARDAHETLATLKISTGADIFITDVRDNLVAGTDTGLWSKISETPFDREKVSHDVNVDGRVFSVLSQAITDANGRQTFRFASARDVTQAVREQADLSRFTLFGVLFLALGTLLVLYVYLRSAFSPLVDAIEVLQAISRGDTSVMIGTAASATEIGQIASAVEVFREHTVTLTRMEARRDRQRRRQERFIRGQMQSLADTLEPDDRTAILKDLEEIEQQAAARAKIEAGEASAVESLNLLSAVFRQLGLRIRDQYGKLSLTVAELREALATKTRFIALQQELHIAQQVQLALLPKHDLRDTTYDISGAGIPAKEVGGDFMDYFALDANHIAIVIADVSGKGVPAAFFMANARATVRGAARIGDTPADTLGRANDLLEMNNDEMLFVTLFYGILDTSTGEMIYSNAGHPPPLVMHTDGSVDPVPMTGDPALAVAAGHPYTNATLQLAPGDRFVSYTDGVTEAFDVHGTIYSEPRLFEFLRSSVAQQTRTARELSKVLVDEILSFQEGAGQADDITTVTLFFDAQGKLP